MANRIQEFHSFHHQLYDDIADSYMANVLKQ